MLDESFSTLQLTSDLNVDSIENLVILQEKEYINKNKDNKEWLSKYSVLNKLKNELINRKRISLEDYYTLRSYAVSKGGFLTNELRKELWKVIYCLEYNDKEYELYYIDETKEDYDDYDVFKFENEPFDLSKYNLLIYRN